MVDTWAFEVAAIGAGILTLVGVLVTWFVPRRECGACLAALHHELNCRATLVDLRDVLVPLYTTLNAAVHVTNWLVQAQMMMAQQAGVTGLIPPDPIKEAEMPVLEREE